MHLVALKSFVVMTKFIVTKSDYSITMKLPIREQVKNCSSLLVLARLKFARLAKRLCSTEPKLRGPRPVPIVQPEFSIWLKFTSSAALEKRL